MHMQPNPSLPGPWLGPGVGPWVAACLVAPSVWGSLAGMMMLVAFAQSDQLSRKLLVSTPCWFQIIIVDSAYPKQYSPLVTSSFCSV